LPPGGVGRRSWTKVHSLSPPGRIIKIAPAEWVDPGGLWYFGVATSLLIVALHATALQRGQLAVQQVLIVLSVGYTMWIVVAIWRSAANADPYWGTLARWLTIAWALNSVLVLFFLQVELALRYARG
jgi:xanthine/uracil permease